MKRLLICLLTAGILLLTVSCGVSEKSYSVNERFSLGDNKYALEKSEKTSETATENDYEISLLIVGDEAPVMMNMTGGKTQTTSGIEMVLNDGNEKITSKETTFEHMSNQGDYGIRAVFLFSVPKDKELPEEATLINKSNKEESVVLDLEDLPGWDD